MGATLAAAGAAYQGLFRNPLVSPDILGASSGAALGAVLGIYWSLGVVGIQALAFGIGLVAVAVVYAIGISLRREDHILTLVLAGVVIGTLLGSCVSLLKYLADPYNQLPAITFWLLGSLTAITLADLGAVLPAVLAGAVPLVLLRWRMNLMTLPEDEARALGVDTGRMRLGVVAAATLMTAAVVSVSGIVGWIGLLVPHFARLLVGPDFGRLLPVAMLLGAGYLLGVDTLAGRSPESRSRSAFSRRSSGRRSSSGCSRRPVGDGDDGATDGSTRRVGLAPPGRGARVRVRRSAGRPRRQLYGRIRRDPRPPRAERQRQEHAL